MRLGVTPDDLLAKIGALTMEVDLLRHEVADRDKKIEELEAKMPDGGDKADIASRDEQSHR